MKILYNSLKTFIPGLRASPKAVVDALALTGILVDSFEETQIGGKKDYVIGLEVRQNRPDCLGVVGVAREVAAYFELPFAMPKLKLVTGKAAPQVTVKAHADVKRVSVLEVGHLDNSRPSPQWLVDTVAAFGMNSVSLLVDISNYAMLMTGYPNHIFDAGKVVGGLVWHRAAQDDTFTTLDGTIFELTKGKELVVSDNLGPLVLASAVGGRRSAISPRTTSVLAEVAVYDPVKMRNDARGLKVVTEASIRLEKNVSAEHTVWALEFLADCLVRIGGGQVVSAVFDHYPATQKVKLAKISLDVGLPSRVAGIPITPQESERILKRLGFSVSRSSSKLIAVPPSWRLDVEDSMDVAEEVIRIKGFNKIPSTAPALLPAMDVTPKRIYLADALRTQLAAVGFDEVLTLPLTTSEDNRAALWEDLTEVRTANTVNEEFPVLRQGLVGGLIRQQHEYLRKEVGHIQIFEIGKVFGKNGKRYVEYDRLGLLMQAEKAGVVQQLQQHIEQMVRGLGFVRVSYERLGRVPSLANPHAAWVVLLAGKSVGVLYQVKDLALTGNRMVQHTAVAEIDLPSLLEQLSHEHPRGAEELTGKLVVLDANIECIDRSDLEQKLQQATRGIGKAHLWSLEVVDAYTLPTQVIRYTVRVSYRDLSDNEAKTLHDKMFVSQA